MKLEVTEGLEDEFTENGSFAYKDGILYKVLESSKTYRVGSCLGKMRVIVED
jgi:hypothetical protein